MHGPREPLSPSSLRVELTARAELYGQIERRAPLSHVIPSGDLGEQLLRQCLLLLALKAS